MRKDEGHADDFEKDQAFDKAPKYVLVNTHILVGFIGAAACYAWFFIALATPALFANTNAVPFVEGIGRVSFVLGAALALYCVWLCADAFSKHHVRCYVLSALFGILGFAGLFIFSNALGLVLLFEFFLGVGFGLLYPLFGEYISAYFYAQIKEYIHGLFVCAVVMCIPLLFFTGAASFFAVMAVAACAYIAYGISLAIVHPRNDAVVVEKAKSDARQAVSWRSYLSTATAAVACGYALGCIASFEPDVTFSRYGVVLICVLVTCAVLLADSFRKQKINETLMMRFFMPVSAVAVLPLLIAQNDIRLFFALLLLCWSLIPLSCSIIAMFKHVIICELSTLRSFSLGRLVAFLGISFGMVIAFVGFMPSSDGVTSSVISASSVVVFMLLVVFSASFVMVEDNFPEEENFHIHEEDGEVQVEVEQGVPIRKIDMSEDAHARSRVVEQIVISEASVFQAKCEAVSQKFGLSSRQSEVLSMLAKGRNGDYITEKLVISPHTTKAHIYNIYQKTGVHSRQELMDLVENSDYDEAKLYPLETIESTAKK